MDAALAERNAAAPSVIGIAVIMGGRDKPSHDGRLNESG
jgi:hypothetical protein